MAPTVFLHIGMPKCATTTVQQFLSENTAWLSQQGFRYEKPSEDKTVDHGNAAVLGISVLHHKRENAKRLLDFYLREQTNVILSSEALIGCARTSKF